MGALPRISPAESGRVRSRWFRRSLCCSQVCVSAVPGFAVLNSKVGEWCHHAAEVTLFWGPISRVFQNKVAPYLGFTRVSCNPLAAALIPTLVYQLGNVMKPGRYCLGIFPFSPISSIAPDFFLAAESLLLDPDCRHDCGQHSVRAVRALLSGGRRGRGQVCECARVHPGSAGRL